MIQLFSSNKLEELIEPLVDIVSHPLHNPFQPETILVQSRGMERWLSLQLCTRLGIWANCKFPFPNSFMKDILTLYFPNSSKDLFNPSYLTWTIFELLANLSDNLIFSTLYNYHLGDEKKRFQLAEIIADQFDQYLIFRPDFIDSWESGLETHWQAELWREITKKIGSNHRSHYKNEFTKLLLSNNFDKSNLPERISLFGIPYLTPYHLEFFHALSSQVEINIFSLNPSQEFWDDIISPQQENKLLKRFKYQVKKKSVKVSRETYHFDQGNTLLSILGSYGKNFYKRLHEIDLQEFDYFKESPSSNLLRMLQNDILTLCDNSKKENKFHYLEDFPSIQFHICHNPMREIEILYENLLQFMERIPNLKTSDILVMAPDIEKYTPYIDAVFGSPEQLEKRIPYTITDRSFRNDNTLTQVVETIFSVASSRFNATSVLGLLEFETIQKAFKIGKNQVSLIRHWIQLTEIAWGKDGASKQDLQLPQNDLNTWEYGIKRLLLGYSFPNDNEVFNGIAGLSEIEGDQVHTLAHFLDFLHTLFDLSKKLSLPYTLPEWYEVLKHTVTSFNDSTPDTSLKISALLERFKILLEVPTRTSFKGKISWETFAQYFREILTRERNSSGFYNGNVTFCSMLPMRSIPFRVIYLLGMNESDYPRMSVYSSWDLIGQNPRMGDRSLEQEDQYLFLESLISARDIFCMSYIGYDQRSGTPKAASTIVSELQNYLLKNYPTQLSSDLLSHLVFNHQRQSYNPSYFKMGSRIQSFSNQIFEASISHISFPKETYHFISTALDELDKSYMTLSLQDLFLFYKNPCKYLFQNRLGINLNVKDESCRDEEPFRLDQLEKYELGQFLLEKMYQDQNINESYNLILSQGKLPHGMPGRAEFDFVVNKADVMIKKIKKYNHKRTPNIQFANISVDEFEIHTMLDLNNSDQELHYRYASLKGTDFLKAWFSHVYRSLYFSSDKIKTILIAPDQTVLIKPLSNDPKFYFQDILKFFWKGCHFPIPFFPKTSWNYTELIISQDELAFEKALSKSWYANYEGGFGESLDLYFSFCFNDESLINKDEFDQIARKVLTPILEHCENLND